MKNILSTLLFSVFLLLSAQEYNFQPNWKKGDSRRIEFTENLKVYEGENLVSENTTNSFAIIKVTKETKADYNLEMLIENKVISIVKQLDKSLESDLAEYDNLRLLYSVNKKTAKLKLLNFEESQKSLHNSIDKIYSSLKAKNPEENPNLDQYANNLKETFGSEKKINDFVETSLGYLFVPFNKNFVLGETISENISQVNAINPVQEISATTLTTLESINKDTKVCSINHRIEVDVEKILTELKKAFSAFLGSDEDGVVENSENMKLLDGIKIDIQNNQNISFNHETSWSDMSSEVSLSTKDPIRGIESRKEIKISAVAK